MSFLPEYALLPEVLEATGEVACINLRSVFELCLREGIVRNLHSGRWRHRLVQNLATLSPAGQKVFEFLDKSGRLISCPKALPKAPNTSDDWCREAIASRQHRELRAIFAEKATAAQFAKEPIVMGTDEAIERAGLRPANSIELRFHADDYCRQLAPLIRVAREVCFIDPYIDPGHSHYRDGFLKILGLATTSPFRPRIEIHRMSAVGSGSKKQELCSENDWRPIFDCWHRQLVAWDLRAEVFIWSKFQSRYFLTNHVGLMAGKGFKSDPGKKERHHWGRLERVDYDGVRRDFNSLGNSPVHERKCQFNIGVS